MTRSGWARWSGWRGKPTRSWLMSTSGPRQESNGSCCGMPRWRSSDRQVRSRPSERGCRGAGPDLVSDVVSCQPREGIDGDAAIGVYLQVQMRTRRVAGVAGQPNDLRGRYHLANVDRDLRHVSEVADGAFPVADLHQDAEARLRASIDHGAGGHRGQRSAHGDRKVLACMQETSAIAEAGCGHGVRDRP